MTYSIEIRRFWVICKIKVHLEVVVGGVIFFNFENFDKL